VAAWHASWLNAFGLRWTSDDDAWRAIDRPHFIYLVGITLRPKPEPRSIAAVLGAVCDSWSALDLSPFGFEARDSEPWFFRAPEPAADDRTPDELEVGRATTPRDVEEFEAVSVRGFDTEQATVEPGSVHPATVLGDPRMVLWLARVDGTPVGAAMSYRTDEAVGVFGVTVVASARRRGYGTALTRAAILPETGLPSILAPSPMAERLYERLGYRRVGELRKWASAP
jgi:GNAT superfamily N-acetyltransferase